LGNPEHDAEQHPGHDARHSQTVMKRDWLEFARKLAAGSEGKAGGGPSLPGVEADWCDSRQTSSCPARLRGDTACFYADRKRTPRIANLGGPV